MRAKRFIAVAAVAAVAATALTSCVASKPAGDGQVIIYGGYGEAQAKAFQSELDAWSETSGIKVTFTSLASFDTDIKTKVTAGQEPDIAMWPQSGGLLDMSDSLLPLSEVTDIAPAQASLVPGWDTLAVKDRAVYGLPVSANLIKTLVFYNPAEFEKHGYNVPTTDAELTALTAKIKADGSGYPWCAGIESGGATGWAITDWLEQYVLDYNGVDVYNKWITGEVKFDSPEVTKAADKVAATLLAEGQVNGGGAAMATDNFGNTKPLFETGGKAKGQCFLLRQGSFITDFFPDAIKAEVAAGDYTHANVFPLPAPEGAQAGVLGAGDLAAAFHNDADVAKVLDFILSDKVGTVMAADGSFVSPHKTFDTSLYKPGFAQTIGQAMATADFFGFDASDRMASAVKEQFWLSATRWVVGEISWSDLADEVQRKY